MEQLNREFLQLEYEENGRTYEDIAKEIGCDKTTVMYWAKKYGIQSRRCGGRRLDIQVDGEFDSLKVLEPIEGDGHLRWLCECKCGNRVEVTASHLLGGDVKRCWECRSKAISDKKWKGCGEISGEFWGRVKRSARIRD